VFYTDGITDSANARQELFGEEQLKTAIATNPRATAQAMLDTIMDAVDAFVGDTPQADDMTLFIVKRLKSD